MKEYTAPVLPERKFKIFKAIFDGFIMLLYVCTCVLIGQSDSLTGIRRVLAITITLGLGYAVAQVNPSIYSIGSWSNVLFWFCLLSPRSSELQYDSHIAHSYIWAVSNNTQEAHVCRFSVTVMQSS